MFNDFINIHLEMNLQFAFHSSQHAMHVVIFLCTDLYEFTTMLLPSIPLIRRNGHTSTDFHTRIRNANVSNHAQVVIVRICLQTARRDTYDRLH